MVALACSCARALLCWAAAANAPPRKSIEAFLFCGCGGGGHRFPMPHAAHHHHDTLSSSPHRTRRCSGPALPRMCLHCCCPSQPHTWPIGWRIGSVPRHPRRRRTFIRMNAAAFPSPCVLCMDLGLPPATQAPGGRRNRQRRLAMAAGGRRRWHSAPSALPSPAHDQPEPRRPLLGRAQQTPASPHTHTHPYAPPHAGTFPTGRGRHAGASAGRVPALVVLLCAAPPTPELLEHIQNDLRHPSQPDQQAPASPHAPHQSPRPPTEP